MSDSLWQRAREGVGGERPRERDRQREGEGEGEREREREREREVHLTVLYLLPTFQRARALQHALRLLISVCTKY